MAWTKEDFEEVETLIAYQLSEITNSIDRRKDAEVALRRIRGIKNRGFDWTIFKQIRASIEFIKINILQKEEREIFRWETIHERTLVFDKKIEKFEKGEIKYSRKEKKEKEDMQRISEERNLLKKTEDLIKLEKIQLNKIAELIKLHKKIEELVEETEGELEILEEIRKQLGKEYRKKEKDEKKIRKLNNESSESVNLLIKHILQLTNLLEKDDKACAVLRTNDYIIIKIDLFLNRKSFRSLFKSDPNYDVIKRNIR